MTGICERGHDDDCRVVPSGDMEELKPVAWHCVSKNYPDLNSLVMDADNAPNPERFTETPLYPPEALEAAFRLALEVAAGVATSDWETLKLHIHNGAIKWCGTKERETDGDDIAYFKHNWDAPGLLKFVIAAAILAIDPAQHLGRE